MPCHVLVYSGAGVMAPSVDKSAVLCRDDGGLWTPSVPSVPAMAWRTVAHLGVRREQPAAVFKIETPMYKLPGMLQKGSLDLQRQEKHGKGFVQAEEDPG